MPLTVVLPIFSRLQAHMGKWIALFLKEEHRTKDKLTMKLPKIDPCGMAASCAGSGGVSAGVHSNTNMYMEPSIMIVLTPDTGSCGLIKKNFWISFQFFDQRQLFQLQTSNWCDNMSALCIKCRKLWFGCCILGGCVYGVFVGLCVSDRWVS